MARAAVEETILSSSVLAGARSGDARKEDLGTVSLSATR